MRPTKPHDRTESNRRDATRDLVARLTTTAPAGTLDGSTAGGEPADPTDRQSGGAESGRPVDTADYAWLAVLPALATLAGVVTGAAFGFGVFDTATPGVERLVAYTLLVPYFLLGVAGTVWLYEDATRLRAADANWQPNPWHYVLAGALVLELYYFLPVLGGGGPEADVVPYLAGGFVLALALSSVVAGPAYAVKRRRHLGNARLTPSLRA